MRKLSEEEVCTDSKVTWYLPHGFLINPKKPDGLRRVYDASAKFRGQSLNDKMYTGPDQQALRFLWRESPSEEQSVYQFQRTLFGEVSAPSRAMRRNANEIGEMYLLASKLFTSIFFVDDGLPSTDSREEAIEMWTQLTNYCAVEDSTCKSG